MNSIQLSSKLSYHPFLDERSSKCIVFHAVMETTHGLGLLNVVAFFSP